MVSTPAKCPDRDAPSNSSASAPGDTVTCRRPPRIDIGDGWHPHDVDARPLTHRQIGWEGSRVPVEILARTELQWVDEDTGRDRHAVGSSHPEQRGVPGMQRAHRRHQTDRRDELGACGGQLRAGPRDDHPRSRHVDDLRGPRGRQSAGLFGPLRRPPGHRDIHRHDVGRLPAQSLQMAGHGGGVTARHRARHGAVAEAKRIVQGGTEQRGDEPGGGLDTGLGKGVRRVVDERDEVVGAHREGRMVERAGPFRNPDRVAAKFDDQRLGHRPQLVRRRDPETRALEPLEVLRSAGEGHHRV